MTREAGRHFFDGKDGVADFAELFGDKDTLVIYSFMYGPPRKTGCPMCTSQLSAWDGIAPHVKQRAALVITARSPIKRILAYGKERGWEYLRLYSDPGGNYTRDYVSAEDADMPGATTSSPARTALSAISGAAKGARRPPTPARIHTTRRTCQRCG